MAEYERSIAAGQPVNSAMQLRLAQIDVQLGHPDQALKRLETLRARVRVDRAPSSLPF